MQTQNNKPLIIKKYVHKRSKTLTVLINQQNVDKLQTKYKQQKTKKKISTKIQPNFIKFQKADKRNHVNKKNINEQIEKIIKKEIQKSQTIRSTKSISERQKIYKSSRTIENNNKFTQGQYYDPIKIQSKTRVNFSQNLHEYLTTLRAQKSFNTRPFMPQYNWKQKLIRSKYMGNYGMIFKKPSTSTSMYNSNPITNPNQPNSFSPTHNNNINNFTSTMNQLIISEQKLQFQQLCNRHKQQLRKLSLNQKHLTIKQKQLQKKQPIIRKKYSHNYNRCKTMNQFMNNYEENEKKNHKLLIIEEKQIINNVKQELKNYVQFYQINNYINNQPDKHNTVINNPLKEQKIKLSTPKRIDLFKNIQSPKKVIIQSPKKIVQIKKVTPQSKWSFEPWEGQFEMLQ